MITMTNLRKQAGLSLSGLILALVLVGIAFVVGMQVVPALVEFQSIKKAVVDARNSGTSAAEIEAAFTKATTAGYITSISGKDLTIVKEDGAYVVSFAYEKKLPLFGPASILLEFTGTTDKQH